MNKDDKDITPKSLDQLDNDKINLLKFILSEVSFFKSKVQQLELKAYRAEQTSEAKESEAILEKKDAEPIKENEEDAKPIKEEKDDDEDKSKSSDGFIFKFLKHIIGILLVLSPILIKNFDSIKNVFKKLNIIDKDKSFSQNVLSLFEKLQTSIEKYVFDPIGNYVKNIVTNLWESILSDFKESISNILEGLPTWLSDNLPDTIKNLINDSMNDATQGNGNDLESKIGSTGSFGVSENPTFDNVYTPPEFGTPAKPFSNTPTPDAVRNEKGYESRDASPVPSGASGESRSLSDIISLGESGGNYDITFGTNKFLSTEEFSGGKKLTEMTLSEVLAFQDKRNSIAKNTGAVGKYQFISSTLKWLIQLSKLNPNTTKFTPEVQDHLQSILLKENMKALQRKGVPVTRANLSLSHYVGAGGVSAVYQAVRDGKGDLSVRDAIKEYTGKDIGAQNQELTRIKAKDFTNAQSAKLERKAKERGINLPVGYFQEEINPESIDKPNATVIMASTDDSINKSSQEAKTAIDKQKLQDQQIALTQVAQAPVSQNQSSGTMSKTSPAKPGVAAGEVQKNYAAYYSVA